MGDKTGKETRMYLVKKEGWKDFYALEEHEFGATGARIGDPVKLGIITYDATTEDEVWEGVTLDETPMIDHDLAALIQKMQIHHHQKMLLNYMSKHEVTLNRSELLGVLTAARDEIFINTSFDDELPHVHHQLEKLIKRITPANTN